MVKTELNATEAAALLGINERTLRRWLEDPTKRRQIFTGASQVGGEWIIPADFVEHLLTRSGNSAQHAGGAYRFLLGWLRKEQDTVVADVRARAAKVAKGNPKTWDADVDALTAALQVAADLHAIARLAVKLGGRAYRLALKAETVDA